MATTVRTVTISNNSKQLVKVAYESIDPLLSVTDVNPAKSGTLNVQPNTQVTIEANRINRGQLDNLANLVNIRVTDGAIST
jgi:hypothetical protein